MGLLLVSVLVPIALGAVIGRRRRARRWVSPYEGFREASARVTRTGRQPFRVAAVQMARSAPSQ